MTTPPNPRTPQLLRSVRNGDAQASAELLDVLYEDLRALAHRAMVRERGDHTLQTTALVHEAFLRLLQGERPPTVEDRAHFLGLAARAMRRVLVDHARARRTVKRGSDRARVPLDDVTMAYEARGLDLLAVEQALARLAAHDPALETLVELRFYAGLSHEEIAAVLDVSTKTVQRRWALARAFLHRELEDDDERRDT